LEKPCPKSVHIGRYSKPQQFDSLNFFGSYSKEPPLARRLLLDECKIPSKEQDMEAKHLEELMVHYNLDHEKIDKMINRAVKACFAFEEGEMTLKQVWSCVIR